MIARASLALLLTACLGFGVQAAGAHRPAGPDPLTARVRLDPYVSGLVDPVALAAPNDGSGRLFAAERAGRIRIVKAGVVASQSFLDISNRVDAGSAERGLLGLAFHPHFAENGVFVVSYTAREPAGTLVYARGHVSADADLADASSLADIISWPHPRPDNVAGDLKFGPDGKLYLATGDAGGVGDPDGTAQNRASLLGKVLRLDIDGDPPYRVPADNPFVGDATARPEVWATGLRNPRHLSFDKDIGDLYLIDRGESQYEELNFQPAAGKGGANYGWNVMEGIVCYNAPSCDRSDKVPPVTRYLHTEGGCVSVVGGHVYRGSAFPDLSGLYIYGDACLDVVIGAARNDAGLWLSAQIGQVRAFGLQAFGEDADGELYAAGRDGRILRVASAGEVPTPGPSRTPSTPFPTRPPMPTATPSERRVLVTASEFRFQPSRIEVDVDQVLNVQLANAGQAPHDVVFELDDFRVESSDRTTGGSSTEFSFYAPAVPGRYVYYCSVGDHRSRGMEGTLVVGQCPGGCQAYLPWAVK